MNSGSCRFGLWYLHVYWGSTLVFRSRFSRVPLPGPVPREVTRFLSGMATDLSPLKSDALSREGTAGRVYNEVCAIPYGTTATYGEISTRAGTAPRAVGTLMRLNPTPLLIPCHRVVAADGLGGFSPDVTIKEALLRLERRGKGQNKREKG